VLLPCTPVIIVAVVVGVEPRTAWHPHVLIIPIHVHSSTTKPDKVIKDVGLGTFGRVVECSDERQPGTRGGRSDPPATAVAIKMVRSIPKYVESARIEADILKDVNRRGGRGTSHCVQLLRHFAFQGAWR